MRDRGEKFSKAAKVATARGEAKACRDWVEEETSGSALIEVLARKAGRG